MDLSFRAHLALSHFLERPTWFSSQPADLNHWFDFVHAYALDHGTTIDVEELQSHLTRKLNLPPDSPLALAIQQRVLLARQILAFLERVESKSTAPVPSSDEADALSSSIGDMDG